MPQPLLDFEAEDAVERALAITYRVVLPRLLNTYARSKLGYARPRYLRELVQTAAYFKQLAIDVGEPWAPMMIRAAERDQRQRRIEREHLEDACIQLVEVVAALPASARRVVEMRSAGASWRKIARAMPDRVFFSIKDDWDRAVALLWNEHSETISRCQI